MEVTRPCRQGAMLAALCLLGACAARPVPPPVVPPVPPSRIEPAIEKAPTFPASAHIEVRRCPAAAEIARLRDARPKPLRDQKMPTTTSERVAKVAAQLGLYEAVGQWADQVERALRKCDER